jgi:hypothetical protein
MLTARRCIHAASEPVTVKSNYTSVGTVALTLHIIPFSRWGCLCELDMLLYFARSLALAPLLPVRVLRGIPRMALITHSTT